MTKLELLRVDFRMTALVRDGKGNVTQELQVATGQAYAHQLGQLPKELRDLFEQAQDEWAKQQRKVPKDRQPKKPSRNGKPPTRPRARS